ncbi:conserved hypothetical protein [Methylocella tundrae]|uniref:Cysteine rich repeat-containing protein n=1 Tax=Methylocella tundrae TaxID=227605 RepID=A0A4U8Z2P2_METTU|nr:hypothetical protein [Methylocella tundrae]WPP03559.1 hypothetical protein SIN04_13910 [Methylocella tundrae]VFU09666.1 conserved protein of unknown function [Methylocella tundrae]VTZ28322.1 conserved hypothetical protein [Methylocella tundrae]VTZ48086.1 conserved hypothetical protein [Methylocella tundrae]
MGEADTGLAAANPSVRAARAKRGGLLGVIFAFSASAACAQGLEGTPEEREACTPDALNLCQAYIPDAERIKECLIQHVSDLSPACREVFEPKQKKSGLEYFTVAPNRKISLASYPILF